MRPSLFIFRVWRVGLLCLALCAQSFVAEALTIEDAQIVQNPNPRVPLAWVCTFRTDAPAQVTLRLHNGRSTRRLPTNDALALVHEVVVLGVRPDRENFLEIKATDAQGAEAKRVVLKWDVEALPPEMPELEVYTTEPKRMEPGITLIPCNRWKLNGIFDTSFGALMGLNAHGDVVWSYQADHTITEAKPLRNGNLLIHYGREGQILEIDMLGNTIRRWHTTLIPKKYYEGSIPIDAQSIHHDVIEMSSGNFMALSTEVRYYADYPDSEVDPDVPWYPAYVVGDVVIEFQPDGTIVKRIKLLDLLDPFRLGYDSLSEHFWSDLYVDRGLLSARPVDWSHANSIDYNPVDDSLMVSINHQDAVIGIDYSSGELSWIMGYPTGWAKSLKSKIVSPTGEGHYFFHQHSARRTPVGSILLFDNGNYRARPFDPRLAADKNFSRVVEIELDTTTKTYKEIWNYGGRKGEMFYSPILSEADWLPITNNILITDGARIRRPNGTAGGHPNQGKEWARVLEVTRTTPAEKVFEVVLDDPQWGWTIYRSERIPSLYLEGSALKPQAYSKEPPVLKTLEVEREGKALPEIEEDVLEDLESIPYL